MPAPKKPTSRSKPSRRDAGIETGESHSRFPSTSTTDPAKVKAFAVALARMLRDNKCEDVVLMDVTALSHVSDFIIVATGSSDRQMRSSADDAADLAVKHTYTAFRKDVDDRSTWIVVDFVDVVIHLFEPNTRAHYDLEMLWADAPRLEWERPDQMNRNRAGLE